MSSAVKFLESKESEILPTKFEELAMQVKNDIQSNIFGSMLVFPEDKKATNRKVRFDAAKRGLTVAMVNQYRDSGMTGKDACRKLGVPFSSYSHWCNVLRVLYVNK